MSNQEAEDHKTHLENTGSQEELEMARAKAALEWVMEKRKFYFAMSVWIFVAFLIAVPLAAASFGLAARLYKLLSGG